jgi:hypothetical protein
LSCTCLYICPIVIYSEALHEGVGSSMRRSEADTAEVLPKISFVEVERVGMGRSMSQLKVLGSRLIKELCFEYFSEGLKKDWKSLFEEGAGL